VSKRLGKRAAVTSGAALGATAVLTPGAEAATFEVTSLADDGSDGTLRSEIEDANAADGDDTIVFQSGLSGTITLTGAQGGAIEIYYDGLQIQGPGAGEITVDGGGGDRLFDAYDFDVAGEQVSITGLTFTDGSVATSGGAIRSSPGIGEAPDVTITDSVLIDNESTSVKGGAVAVYGGGVTVRDSVVSENDAADAGGGVYAFGLTSDVVIERSTFSGNTVASGDGGGIYVFRSYNGAGLTVDSSTLSGNEVAAGRGGGGITIFGLDGPATIENTTVSGNSAANRGGGVYLYTNQDEPVTIRNSTIVDNIAGETGGGVYRYGFDNLGEGDEDNVAISSSIVANNTAPDDGDLGDQYSADGFAVDGSFILGFSLVEDDGGAVTTEAPAGSNIFGTDPGLGPLADNGGPTLTHLPALTSPAIDAGIANALATDQRGFSRTVDQATVANAAGSDATDIGSVELEAVPGGDGDGDGAAVTGKCQGKTATKTDGTPDDDVLTGTGDPDLIFGHAGDDAIKGLGAADCLNGDEGNDVLRGGGGGDLAKGGSGNDKLRGQTSKDKLKGQAGKDNLNGGGGKDKLNGGPGKDKLKGGPGRDKLKGGRGKDKLIAASSEKDRVNCGGGRDKARVDADDKVSKTCEKVVEVGD
jgi:hypothetical protein